MRGRVHVENSVGDTNNNNNNEVDEEEEEEEMNKGEEREVDGTKMEKTQKKK